ncbi:hypothetical protein GCM10020218_019780 [Dactylosporangium vinaceum]|uniref:Uncharacterized protein n=1 Tax=Dactylosporangium vinaceum TaxID=53362 RepID=A0ABV5MEX7_9ACTN|nr:hypothetical protein [Dactylosporangium vinaceum]
MKIDDELITVAVPQVLLGHHNENRWIRAAAKPSDISSHNYPNSPDTINASEP